MAISVGMLPRCNVVAAATDGTVKAIAVDPATGDVYFGGTFTTVNGQARANLAAVTKNGKLKAWNPGATGISASVTFMRWTSLGIFICGNFTTLAGGSRNTAGLVDTTATLQTWDPQSTGSVAQVDVDSNSIIFLVGTFSAIRGTSRTNAAAMTSANVLQSWQPEPTGTLGVSAVYCVRVSGTLVYLGGAFQQVILASTGLAGTRNFLACINGVNGLGSDGKATAFDANVGPVSSSTAVDCLDVDGLGNVYFGGGSFGSFSIVLGSARPSCASVTSTPSLNTWAPATSGMYSVLVDGSNVYWSGRTAASPFWTTGCMNTSAVDMLWHPDPNGGGTVPPYCFGADGAGVIWMGGSFTNVLGNNFTRMHLAKFKDATVTPTALAW